MLNPAVFSNSIIHENSRIINLGLLFFNLISLTIYIGYLSLYFQKSNLSYIVITFLIFYKLLNIYIIELYVKILSHSNFPTQRIISNLTIYRNIQLILSSLAIIYLLIFKEYKLENSEYYFLIVICLIESNIFYIFKLTTSFTRYITEYFSNQDIDLDRSLIEILDTEEIGQDELCSICLDYLQQHYEVVKLDCGHKYHTTCLTRWIKEKYSCPDCRKKLILFNKLSSGSNYATI